MKLSILICSLESRRRSLSELINSLAIQFTTTRTIEENINYNQSSDPIEVTLCQPDEWGYISYNYKDVSLIKYISLHDEIEIIIATDNKQMSVGGKRNLLVEQATGDYIVFIDDDDRITGDYIELLLKGIETGYDSVCFDVMYNPAGGTQKLVKYSCNMKDAEFSTHFERATNHIMCIKRSIASSVKFKNINFGEDAIWAKQVSRLIRSEARIPKVLYYYDFDHGKSETQ